MSTNRYFDSEERQGSNNTGGGSYTDRFRTDGAGEASRYTRSSTSATASERLRSMIERACRPTLVEPDLALNLEVADLINSKKGNLSREAASRIVGLVNSSNPHVSILAMGLLDICVKNCGYPFHLQISRKEFLNELVRKFPERPPMSYSRTHLLILEAIEEWRQTICRTSRYKDDFGYIRDMHRLLSYKGYSFPEVNKDDAAVLNPSDTLKSAQELEDEERDAQSAKLEELLRRATPADLQEANHLMSIMAGFRESQTDYRAKAAKDLDKVRRKGEILEEMLNNIDPNTGLAETDDVFAEIVDALKNARPKIKKMIDEEGEQDEEALVKLLALNDFVSALIEKYDLVKSSKFEEAKQISVVAVPGTEHRKKTDTSSKAAITQSLIDIDDDGDDTSAAVASDSPGQPNTTTEDLLGSLDGLSFGPTPSTIPGFGIGGSISLNSPILSSSPTVDASRSNTVSPVNNTTTKTADYSALEALSRSTLSHSSLSPSNNNNNDSFTSFIKPAATPNSSQSLFNDTEWNFGSTPVTSAPSPGPKTKVELLNSSLNIAGEISHENANTIKVEVFFSNNSPIQAIRDINFKFAVPKTFQLKMEPQSGSQIAAGAKRGVTQIVHVTNPSPSSTSFNKLKFRWKVDYVLGTNKIEEDGTVDAIPNL